MSNTEFAKRMDRFGAGISSKLAEIKKEKTAKGEEAVDLNIGAPNMPPVPHIMEALCRAATEPPSYVYVIGDGREFLGAVGGWYNIRYGVELDLEIEICSLLSPQEGLVHIALFIVDEGDVMLVPDPCYPVFGDGSQIAGARPHYMPQRKENGYITRPDEISEDVARKAKLMAMSYPNNPTTAMAPDSFYEKLINFARKYDIIVFHDNVYSGLVLDGREYGNFLQFPEAKGIGVKLNSLSRTYGLVGAKVGFCLGNSQAVSCPKLLKSNMDYGVFPPVQAVAIAAVTGDQSRVQATRQVYGTRRNIICDGSTSTGQKMEWPKTTMFVWATIPEHYTTSEALVMELVEQASVMVTSGSVFGLSGGGHVRLALVQDEKMLNKAIRAVREGGALLEEGKRQMPENRNRPALNRWHVVTLVYICFIHGNSLISTSISSQESDFFLKKIRGAMESLGREHLWLTEHIIRKTIHFVECAALGGLMAGVYGLYGRHRICSRDALMLIFMVPFVDETIQIFAAGRLGQISDVWLDMSGAAAGMATAVGAMCCLRKKRTVRQGGRE